MILADTSVWIDHFRHRDSTLAKLLAEGGILGHPAVIGEVGLRHLQDRTEILALMAQLPAATEASHAEVMIFIDRHQLHGSGIGYVDAHLLAATSLSPQASLWTRDRRLRGAAQRLDLSAELRWRGAGSWPGTTHLIRHALGPQSTPRTAGSVDYGHKASHGSPASTTTRPPASSLGTATARRAIPSSGARSSGRSPGR